MSVSSSSISLRSWIVLLSVGVLVFLLNIDYTAVNLTLIPISEEIDADLNTLQWLLSAYVLVWAALVIPAGRVADLYGKRNTLILGLVTFMMGSCLTGLGYSIEVLILGRILQGIGAAIFSAPAWAIVFTSASPEKQGFVMGIILSFSGLGLAAGPTLAGIIIEEFSWRWIFYINLPIGALIITTLMLYGPKDILSKDAPKVDVIGAFLLASGLCSSMYALNQIEVWGISSIQLWGVLVMGAALIGLYILRDRRQKVRMVPPYLLQNKAYLTATLGGALMSMNFSMILVLMGLYLQSVLHYSSYETGLIFISMTISMGVISPIGGKMIDTLGVKGPMVFGACVASLSFGLISCLGISSSLSQVIPLLFLVGLGLGPHFTACSTAMLWSAPQKDLNVASGVYMMFMMIGNTLSIILSTSLLILFGRSHLLQSSQQKQMALSPEQQQTLAHILAKVDHTAAQLKGFSPDQIPDLLQWIDEAFMYGFSINMMMGSILALITAGITMWGIGKLKASQGHPVPVF